ncbi:hypothetical protein [Sideroxydans sp. CL21]|nr:hypothetical protein [Sideroxydans sp. CL21]
MQMTIAAKQLKPSLLKESGNWQISLPQSRTIIILDIYFCNSRKSFLAVGVLCWQRYAIAELFSPRSSK